MIVVYSGSKFELKIKYDTLKNGDFNEYVMSVSMLVSIFRNYFLAHPGMDSITPEHLQYPLDANVINYLSLIFSLCF